jgi:tetratricopeptide (TPR) repeat protein
VAGFCLLTWQSPLGSARNPEWEAGLYARAASRLRADGKPAEAAAAGREALRLDPGEESTRLLLAELAMEAGDLDGAIAHLRAAVAADSTDLRMRQNLGILLYQAERPRESLAVMERLTAGDSAAVIPLLYEGLARKDLGDLAGGAECLERAVALDPRLRGPYLGLIEIALRTGNPDAARRWLAAAEANGVDLPPEVRRAVPGGDPAILDREGR